MNAAFFIEILKFIISLHGPGRSRKRCAADVLMEGSWGHHWKFTNHTITVHLFIYSIFICDVPVTCRQSTFVYLKHKIMADKSTIKCDSVTVKTTRCFYKVLLAVLTIILLLIAILSPEPTRFGQQWRNVWCSEQNWKLEPENPCSGLIGCTHSSSVMVSEHV